MTNKTYNYNLVQQKDMQYRHSLKQSYSRYFLYDHGNEYDVFYFNDFCTLKTTKYLLKPGLSHHDETYNMNSKSNKTQYLQKYLDQVKLKCVLCKNKDAYQPFISRV